MAPDSCDAEKMPSETHPDGCVVECPEVAEDGQAGPANATDTDAEGDPGSSADGEVTGSFGIAIFCSTAVSREAWAKLGAEPLILPRDVCNSL